ncbi:hypothetical protein SASPL_124207 [Salvia splendens]|uniref:Response regulatory domain-containing protein n=2 Tax=Salvia splendens TaxID=180675 RepID=A0A8X8XQJ1_SALSN|nr:hypothetical protein SASPL_124207 [Salvia splendens]
MSTKSIKRTITSETPNPSQASIRNQPAKSPTTDPHHEKKQRTEPTGSSKGTIEVHAQQHIKGKKDKHDGYEPTSIEELVELMNDQHLQMSDGLTKEIAKAEIEALSSHRKLLKERCLEAEEDMERAGRLFEEAPPCEDWEAYWMKENTTETYEKMKKGGQKFSALVVDDNKMIRKVEEKLLARFGFETKVVENGEKALKLFDDGYTFDVVVMDMEMPVMNGPVATRALRARGVDCMIVGVTSCGDGPEKAEFEASGLNCCWEKPLNAEIVGTILNKLDNKMS